MRRLPIRDAGGRHHPLVTLIVTRCSVLELRGGGGRPHFGADGVQCHEVSQFLQLQRRYGDHENPSGKLGLQGALVFCSSSWFRWRIFLLDCEAARVCVAGAMWVFVVLGF